MRFHLDKWRDLAKSQSGVFRIRRRLFLHKGPDTVEELLERHVAKEDKGASQDGEERGRLTSTRRETLSLYRNIIRATRYFTWRDARGALWRDVLRENARKEFEAARVEKDPKVVTRLLIGGHDAVEKAAARGGEGTPRGLTGLSF